MNSFGQTDKGYARVMNQDCYLIDEKNNAILAVVCDGIGGHQAGDVASRLTCETLKKYFDRNFDGRAEWWLKNALKRVNKVVYEKGRSDPAFKGMGTTMVAAIITDDKLYVLNVGDSRAYVLSDGNQLVQISEDHSLVNDLVKKEGMDPEKAREIGQHVITKAIGIWPTTDGDLFEVTDSFKSLMLCSDGLHNYVPAFEIVDVLSNKKLSGYEKCQKLVDSANDAGGFDNTTVVIVER